jgi:DNA ligase N terminus
MANSEENLSFEAICSLLDKLEALRSRYKLSGTKLTQTEFRRRQKTLLCEWSHYYNTLILKDDQSILAVLSLLLPDLRTDRVYFLKEQTLAPVIGRTMGIGSLGVNKLINRRPTEGDFGLALERTMIHRV